MIRALIAKRIKTLRECDTEPLGANASPRGTDGASRAQRHEHDNRARIEKHAPAPATLQKMQKPSACQVS